MERTREKDVIKICKGWYDKDKHGSVIDALRAYQVEICDTQPQYVSSESILLFSLYPVAEKYFTTYHWMWMFRDNVRRDINMADVMKRPINFDYGYVCDLFITTIQGLRVKQDNGEWSIDMEGYKDIQHIV